MLYKVKLKNADENVLLDDHVYEWLTADPYLAKVDFINNLRKHSSGCAVFQKTWKKTNGSSAWVTIDSSRDSFNASGNYLLPNLNNAEATTPLVDFTSNGFKLRTNSVGNNGSGEIIIYMAFAENPFANSNAR